jgi:hypothetical protein
MIVVKKNEAYFTWYGLTMEMWFFVWIKLFVKDRENSDP